MCSFCKYNSILISISIFWLKLSDFFFHMNCNLNRLTELYECSIKLLHEKYTLFFVEISPCKLMKYRNLSKMLCSFNISIVAEVVNSTFKMIQTICTFSFFCLCTSTNKSIKFCYKHNKFNYGGPTHFQMSLHVKTDYAISIHNMR